MGVARVGEQLKQLEGRLGALDGAMLRGASFRACITQPFDVPGQLAVATNKPFLEQLNENIKRLHTECAKKPRHMLALAG